MKKTSLFWKLFALSALLLNAAAWAYFGSRQSTESTPSQQPSEDVISPASEPSSESTIAPTPEFPASAPASAPTAKPAPVESLELEWFTRDLSGLDDPTLRLVFSHPVSASKLSSYLSFSPECTFRVAQGYSRSSITIFGAFRPGETYTMTLQEGFPSETPEISIRAPLVRTFTLPNRRPFLSFSDSGRYLTPSADSALLHLSSVNTPVIQLEARRLRAQNLFSFLTESGSWWNPSDRSKANGLLGGPIATNSLETSAAFNDITTTPFDLYTLLPAAPSFHGTWLVTASFQGPQSSSDSRLIVLSDIGLSVRHEGNHAAIWTTSLSTGLPLPGVRISLVSQSNDPVAYGTTDADGYAELRYTLDPGDALLFASASLADDLTFISLSDGSYNVTPTGSRPPNARAPEPGSAYEAFLMTPRGIVRPGETLPVKTLIRDLQGATPSPFPISLALVRPDGRDALVLTQTLSPLGTAEAEFAFDRAWPTGKYTLQARLPGDSAVLGTFPIVVEEIVPPQLRVSYDSLPTAILFPGDAFSFDISSQYLFGAPGSSLPFQCSYTLSSHPFRPKGWDGYSFGDATQPAQSTLSSGLLASGSFNEFGRTTLPFTIPKIDPTASALELSLQTTVQQSDGRPVSEFVSLPLSSTPWYIGLRPATDGTLFTRTPTEVSIALVAPDGSAVTNQTLSLKGSLKTLHYNWNWSRDQNGDWRYSVDLSTTDLSTLPDLSLSNGTATLSLEFDAPGTYRLTLQDPTTAASATLDFEVASLGDSWVHSGTQNPAAITLTPDLASYTPTDTVQLTVKSPFVGSGMLFLEGAGDTWRHLPVTLTNTATTLSFPIDASDAPSLRATLVVLRPILPSPSTTPHKTLSVHRAIGTCLLPIASPSRALSLSLSAPTETLPQSTLHLSATLSDSTGNPAQGVEVTFAAVDEALCMLTRHRTPDPLAWANAPRWFSAAHHDLFSRLFPVYGELPVASSHIGGDSTHAKHLFYPGSGKRFRSVALWKGSVLTDSNGLASASFQLPEFTGSLRIMALAVGNSLYGSTHQQVLVRRPVTILTSLPRFAAPNDAFDATLDLFNSTPSNLTITLLLTQPDSSHSPLQHTLSLAPGARITHSQRLRAPSTPGDAPYRFQAFLNGSNNPFYSETIPLPIRPATAYTSIPREGTLKPGESTTLTLDATTLLAPTLNVTCSQRPECQFASSLDALVHYPYGCLEQITSTVYPLLYLDDLAAASRPELFADNRCRGVIQAGIRRILALQRPGGGFSLWNSERTPYPWGSLYASRFLFEAQKAGYDIPAANLREAADYAVSILRTPSSQNDPDTETEIRAAAVHVAALAGRFSDARPWLDRLVERYPSLPLAAQAHILSSLLLTGRPREATDLLSSTSTDSATPASFGNTLRSSTRDTALVLSALCDLDPDHSLATDLASALLASRSPSGTWNSTQENAMALLALGKYYRALYGAPTADATPTATFSASSLPSPLSLDLSKPFAWAGSDGTFSLHNTGNTPLFYSFVARGIPSQLPTTPIENNLSIQREFLDATTGKPIPLKNGALILPKGTAIAVRITLTPTLPNLDQIVVSDLLPAGLEIENPALATSAQAPRWVQTPKPSLSWVRSTDLRDDRLILFTGLLSTVQPYTFLYTARAVTVGEYILPAIEAEAMYAPTIKARSLPSRLLITP